MVRAISVYSAGVPYAARFTAAVKIIESSLKAISSDYGSNKEYSVFSPGPFRVSARYNFVIVSVSAAIP